MQGAGGPVAQYACRLPSETLLVLWQSTSEFYSHTRYQHYMTPMSMFILGYCLEPIVKV